MSWIRIRITWQLWSDYSEAHFNYQMTFIAKEIRVKFTHHFEKTFPPSQKILPLFHKSLCLQVLCNVLKCVENNNKSVFRGAITNHNANTNNQFAKRCPLPLDSACLGYVGSQSRWQPCALYRRSPETSAPPGEWGSITDPSGRCPPDKKGLLHISQISHRKITNKLIMYLHI